MLVGVVDDDEGMRDSLAALLQVLGYDTRLFETAEAVIAESADLPRFAAMVIDQHLPGMCGIDLIRRIAGRHIPTILISAQMNDRLRAEALAAGAKAVFDKPLDRTALVAALGAGNSRPPVKH